MTKRKMRKKGHGTYAKCPKGYKLVNVAHSLTQARMIVKSYPKQYKPKIVRTPQYTVYPYHIACLTNPRKRF